jgi:N-acetylglucosamine kinase-like BadF-type ATPase
MAYFIGSDLGGTKTHVMIADESGRALGFGEAGPGSHESVGYPGSQQNLSRAVRMALQTAQLHEEEISGSGFGVAGYDWPIQKAATIQMIEPLNLGGALELVNDTELGLLAGSPRFWGIAVVCGTGCNCRGWDESHTHFGRVTGGSDDFGENAGAVELIYRVGQVLGHAWTGRGPATALADAFCQRYAARNLEELLQSLICHDYALKASDAPLVFEVARQGDAVAQELVRWAGRELGEMACTVIRQLHFESLAFDLVQIGSMWEGSPVLTEEMKNVILPLAPGVNVLRTHEPPVIGAIILGMQAAGLTPSLAVRTQLIDSFSSVKTK